LVLLYTIDAARWHWWWLLDSPFIVELIKLFWVTASLH
jgi:hypothetical protein